jgi:hypothetical protein
VLLRAVGSDQQPALVGVAGYTAPPTGEGEVEIEYAIAAEYHRCGYATEAVEALLTRAFEDPAGARGDREDVSHPSALDRCAHEDGLRTDRGRRG